MRLITDSQHNRHGGDVHTDSVLYIDQYIIVQIRKNRRSSVRTKTNRFRRIRRDRRLQDTTGTHQAIRIFNQRNDIQVDTLQTGSRPHDETMVKSKHNRLACLRVEDTGQTVFHTPR